MYQWRRASLRRNLMQTVIGMRANANRRVQHRLQARLAAVRSRIDRLEELAATRGFEAEQWEPYSTLGSFSSGAVEEEQRREREAEDDGEQRRQVQRGQRGARQVRPSGRAGRGRDQDESE
jgi:hypothetical protein